MRKKFLSIIMSVCLGLGLLPQMEMPVFGAEEGYGDFTVSDENAVTYNSTTRVLTVTGECTISMADGVTETTTDSIVVTGGTAEVPLNITLKDVDIQFSDVDGTCAFDMEGAAVNLTLEGTNTLKSGDNKAGLQAPGGTTLTIDGTGTLDVIGGKSCAGIGGSTRTSGTITINGGTITATGGTGGAGIGGGEFRGGGTTTINGGTVTATGGTDAAGIGGGGNSGGGGTITINGGIVTATGGTDGAGIGGGDAGTITINGGTVIASGGIGGGEGGEGGLTTITGGSVQATNGGIHPAPTTDGTTPAYLAKLPADSFTSDTATPVKVDDTAFNIPTKHDGDDNFYLYLPATGTEVNATVGKSKYTCTVAENDNNVFVAKAVNIIDTESKLRTAIAEAGNGATIQLGGDITVNSPVIIEAEDIILDLNGHTLSSDTNTIILKGTVSLEVKDTSVGATGVLSTTSTGTIYNTSSGSVIISGGTVTSKSYTIINSGSGNVTVSGGTVSGSVYTIWNNGVGTVNVLSGAVSSIGSNETEIAIMSTSGTVNVSGGTISSTLNTSIVCGATSNISGGTLADVNTRVLNISGNPTLTVYLNALASKTVSITGELTGPGGSITLNGAWFTTTTNGTAVATAKVASYADVSKFTLTNVDGKKLVKNGENIELGEKATLSNWADGITDTTDTWDNGGTITTAEELAQFAYNVDHGKDYVGKTIKLSEDINLSEKDWTPIGYYDNNYFNSRSFQGTFDGNGHKIIGITIGSVSKPESKHKYVSLFGYTLWGDIKNLGVEDVTIYSNYNADGAFIGGLVAMNRGTIQNCYATGNITAENGALVGGLVGWNFGGTINNCFATSNLIGGIDAKVGGLVGRDSNNKITNGYWNSNAAQTVNNSVQTKKGVGDGVDNATGMAQSDMQATSFVSTLNANLDTLANTTLYTWKAISNDYPTFSNTLWSGTATHTMSGTIKDMNNNFVSGATVTLTPNAGTPNPATTGTDGKYTINNVPDGSYRITVTLPNGGGSFTKDVAVPGGNFDIKQPTNQTYTVAYHANGGTGSMIAQTTNVGTDTTVSANGFTKAGYTFASWNTAANGSGTTFTTNGTVPSQTAETTVTLYAQWTETTYSVSGIVTDRADKNASGVSVKLMKGNTQIGLKGVITTADGKFTITGVLNGTYNLVLEKDGMVVTKKIVVNSADYTLSDIIKMPNGKINSVVKVEANTPDIVVGNLDAQFDSSDIIHVQTANNAVEIKLVAEKKAVNDVQADVNKIAAVASNKTVGLYLDLSVTKTITTNSVVNSTTQMSTLPSIIEIIIPLPEELQGKDGIEVYRVHNGTATALPKGLANEVDGEYFVVSANFVTLYTKNFSTYAIGYTTPSNNNTGGGSGGGSSSSVVAPTVTAEQSEGGKITISNDKKITEIKPDEGYVIADVIVDGKRIGATENYTFADSKTHKITALFVKEVALPYYIQNGRTVYLGFSAVVEKIYKYTAPNGVKVEFKENPKNFTDNTIAWAKPSIDFVAEREIFFGTTQDKFGPNESMSRGMFVTVIGRLYERSYGNISGTSTFSDVAANDYFAKYVAWATENGIIKRMGENKFGPNDKVTREQMAVIMLNFATFLKKADVKDSSLAYADSTSISSWAIDGAKYCQQTKVISGRDGGNFAPQESATRAEVAAVIERFVKTIVK